MMELIRNCSHQSEIATYLEEGPLGKRIVKVALTPAGIDALRKELGGWQWYQKARYAQRQDPFCRVRFERPSFLSVEIDFIKGISPDYKRGLWRNRADIARAIEHYCSVWSRSVDGVTQLHGDFSLGNIIYNEAGLHVTDWEHFHQVGAPWGFDAVYLLLETLWFGMRGKVAPPTCEIRAMIEGRNLLERYGRLQAEMRSAPIRFVKRFMAANPQFWGAQYYKFPVLQFTESQERAIESALAAVSLRIP